MGRRLASSALGFLVGWFDFKGERNQESVDYLTTLYQLYKVCCVRLYERVIVKTLWKGAVSRLWDTAEISSRHRAVARTASQCRQRFSWGGPYFKLNWNKQCQNFTIAILWERELSAAEQLCSDIWTYPVQYFSWIALSRSDIESELL
jgi:hypothetical protein